VNQLSVDSHSIQAEGECVFVALEIKERERGGIFGGLLSILRKPKPVCDMREVCGARYALIQVECERGGPNWDGVEQLAGRYASRVLVPEGWEIPTGSGISPPSLTRFEETVLLHTACEIIHRTRMPMYRRVVGILDSRGAHGGMLPELLKYYTTAKIYTHNTPYYRQAAQAMMEEYGAPVQLCELPEGLLDCVLVLAPSGVEGCEAVRFLGPVLSPRDTLRAPAAFDHVTELRVLPSPPMRELVPRAVSPHRFAGALYEFCGVNMAGFVAGCAMLNSTRVEFSGLVSLVRQKCGL